MELKHRNYNIQNYNFACGSVWVRNLVSELKEEHRVSVIENRVLRRIFGPKRDEMMEEWKKLHNEELHNMYSSPNVIRMIKSSRMRWEGHVARILVMRNAYRIFVGKPEGKRPLG
jgi:hypothetical protein